eukprot:TRINITY_DN5734_c0_g1_i2.p1 TRINITY_DN5734_c0_g1~~TRINITY_DN5734_c0_g1_i2.p1  ORF type:complete len:379 (-),score=52.33 TRINITY_DN5734_c0_g1_i2:3-1139(-)
MESNGHNSTKMLNVLISGASEPCGFIDVNHSTTLADARELIRSELEGIPEQFRFVVRNQDSDVPVSLPQEQKKKAIDFLPAIIIKEVSAARLSASIQPSVPSATQSMEHSPKESSPRASPVHFGTSSVATSEILPSKASWMMHSVDVTPDSLSLSYSRSPDNLGIKPSRSGEIADAGDWEAHWEKAFGTRTDKIVLDEVPYAIFRVVGADPVTDSDHFRALLSLTINMGPNSYTDSEEFEDPKAVFERIFKSFGPSSEMLTNITTLLKFPWFHGNISSKTAEKMLLNERNGTFLVRLSNSQIGGFAVTSKMESRVRHYSIERTSMLEFKLGKDAAATIPELIRRNASKLFLKYPCPKGPFEKIFEVPQARQIEYTDSL